jgi:hypothetical protein
MEWDINRAFANPFVVTKAEAWICAAPAGRPESFSPFPMPRASASSTDIITIGPARLFKPRRLSGHRTGMELFQYPSGRQDNRIVRIWQFGRFF